MRSTRMIDALDAAGLNPLPVFTASLKDPIGAPLVRELLEQARSRSRPERNRLCRLEPRRLAADAAGPVRSLRPPGRVLRRQRGRLARRHARPLGARSGDERRPAGNRRPRTQPGGRVQSAKALRCRDRKQHRGLRPDRRSGAIHGGAGGRLGATRRYAGCRAAGRDRARELPQPRRPDRQWRRPRCAGKHHAGCSRPCARPAIGSRGCPRTGRLWSRCCWKASPTSSHARSPRWCGRRSRLQSTSRSFANFRPYRRKR